MNQMRDDVVPIQVESFGEALIDPKKLHCVDCHGWPLDNGAVFVAVFIIRSGKAQLGGICELCWLKRLQARGRIVNATSSECSQVDLPQLGINKVKHPRRW
jgi:hypothetical protein